MEPIIRTIKVPALNAESISRRLKPFLRFALACDFFMKADPQKIKVHLAWFAFQ
jgi:hypothetical protein